MDPAMDDEVTADRYNASACSGSLHPRSRSGQMRTECEPSPACRCRGLTVSSTGLAGSSWLTLYGAMVLIRDATENDWLFIYPFFSEIVAAGRTYAYPQDLSSHDARRYWMTGPTGRS